MMETATVPMTEQEQLRKQDTSSTTESSNSSWSSSSDDEARHDNCACPDDTTERSCRLKRPSLPLESWPQRPVYLQPIPGSRLTTTRLSWNESDGSTIANDCCPANRIFDFETPLFKGRALIRIHGLDDDTDASYFVGRQRLHQVVVQGRFLRPDIRVVDVVTGADFHRALRRKPPAWADPWVQKMLARSSPGVQMDLQSSLRPFVHAPFIASLKTVRADLPDEETTMDSIEGIQENAEGFGSVYTAQVKSEKDRKKFLASRDATDVVFDTDRVYTFEVYNEVADYYHYQMNFKVFRLNMETVVDGEPFQIMAKLSSTGEYLWGWNIWHECLLSQDRN